MPLFIDNIIVLMTVHFSHEISNRENIGKSDIFRMKLVPGSQQQFMQVSPEYVLKPDFKWLISCESNIVNKDCYESHLSHILNSVKLKKLEKFIDPLTKECDSKFYHRPLRPDFSRRLIWKSLSKVIEMKQRDERSGSASPGETDCKMNSLRRIVQGLYSSIFLSSV